MKITDMLVVLLAAIVAAPVFAESPPNILLVVADDLGYGDLACFGDANVKTPNIDRLAAEGVKLTDCYSAAAVCSPARTGLMTGRTPQRVGVYSAIPFFSPMHVPESEITIATLLRNAGYATAQCGKWHMNGLFNLPSQPQPDDHGFEFWFSTQNNTLPNHHNPYNFVENDIPQGPIEGYAADIVTDRAMRWLSNERDREKPFFLYVAYHEPHEPIATAPKYESIYAQLEDPAERAYYGNITQMDTAFGRLLAKLDELKLRDDTLVVFTSDNGPALTSFHPYGSAGKMRAKKGYLYEGGIRVPGIVRWPGRVEAGSKNRFPVSGIDILPTFCELAGIEAPKDRTLDGVSLASMLRGEVAKVDRPKPLYWQYNRARSEVKVAIRDGDMKMLARLTMKPPMTPNITAERMAVLKTAGLEQFEMYDLTKDASETNDLAADGGERFEAMKAKMIGLYKDVQSDAPIWPDWGYLRYESERIEWPDYKALRKPPVMK
mgnify:CR=1 FL=1